ncbi:MAG: leucine-rich repeat protein, partial [Eubacteriales bacterium]
SAFNTCTGLSDVTIPGNVTAIGDRAFGYCSGLTQISVDAANLSFESVDGVLFNVETTTLLQFPGGKTGAYAVPPGVTAIGDHAFGGSTGLTSFTFPESVTAIGKYAFGDCTGLTTVTIPDSVTTIMDSAFRYCDGITSLNIGNGVAAIPDSAFCDCDGLTAVTIPRSVTSIGEYAFESCSSLTSVTFLNSQTTISDYAFEQCYDVKIYGYKNSGALTYAKDNSIPYSILQKIELTKTVEGFKVNIKENMADHRYQIWSYQKITSDFFAGETANQWILSKAYTLGSSGDATIESDGSISFMIDDFTSPYVNYTITVREIDENNSFIGEFRDTFTPAEVQEVKITKVLIDGGYSDGQEIMEINYNRPYKFTAVCNGVSITSLTAKVLEDDSALPGNGENEFSWDTSALAPNNYSIEITATNGTTTDTKVIKIKLINLSGDTNYGNISSLTLTPDAGNTVPKNVGIAPSFTNGSFWYRVSEPGREAFYTSSLFAQTDTIQYNITKFGIYQVFGFVNRENEFKIGNYYDDGMFKTLTISRSETEPSSVALNANVDITKPVNNDTPIVFTATADIGGIGSTPVQYSFWRYDAKGYILIKDWSSSNTLDWTPALIGIYTIGVRAKGVDAGSYEAASSVNINVTNPSKQIAQGVSISINEDELNTNANPRAPIAVKASATSANGENLLYKFLVTDDAMGTSILQNYSANQECVWTPRKAGTYTISVLIKNDASFGAYDAMKTFEITVSAPLD